MPRMSGLDLLDHVRGDARLKSLPVVILTTLGEAHDKTRAMRKGASGYIVKLSFQEQDLLDLVRRFVG
jgi:CheY-like chemotaxis protein